MSHRIKNCRCLSFSNDDRWEIIYVVTEKGRAGETPKMLKADLVLSQVGQLSSELIEAKRNISKPLKDAE